MVGGVVEDWFREAVGCRSGDAPRAADRLPDRQYRAASSRVPARLGDTLVLELSIARLGRSSIEFVRGSVGGEDKFRARHKVALVSLDSWRAQPIPKTCGLRCSPMSSTRNT
jgi:hypothetical protein